MTPQPIKDTEKNIQWTPENMFDCKMAHNNRIYQNIVQQRFQYLVLLPSFCSENR